jgi:hypothetical protein
VDRSLVRRNRRPRELDRWRQERLKQRNGVGGLWLQVNMSALLPSKYPEGGVP